MTSAPSIQSTRLSYPFKGRWKTIEELSRQVGFGRAWIEGKLGRSLFSAELRVSRDKPTRPRRCYSPECQNWLKLQAKQFRTIRRIGKYLTLPQAADRLGCSRLWIQEFYKCQAGAIGAIEQRRTPTNRLVDCISPQAYRELQKVRAQTAPADMATASHISQLTGRGHSTVVSHLKHLPVALYLGGDGRLRNHYPVAEAIIILGSKSNGAQLSAGNWMTACRLGVQLNRSWYWVTPRLAAPQIAASRRRLLDDSSILRWHYPPWVLNVLRAQMEAG